jgi:predicted TIM-barrel fold metal-dependent hydrolase
MIVDSQVHIWRPDTPERPWAHHDAHMAEPVTIERLRAIMAGAGVDAAIIVPPSWEGDRNDYALEAARRYPQQFAVMGRLPLNEPAQTLAKLERFLEPGLLGLRCTFHRDEDVPWVAAGNADWLWPALERLNIPLMVHGPGVLPQLGAAAERHPGLRLIIDHLGIRGSTGRTLDAAVGPALDNLVALARLPNVYVKTSCVPSLSSHAYPYRNLFEQLKRVIDAFGPQRCFWGTDYSRLPGSYREAVTMFTDEMDFLSADDKAWIMGRGIARCLGWPASPV